MTDKAALEEKLFSFAPQPFGAVIPKHESFLELPDVAARAKKGAAGYRGKWVVLEHVKGQVNYIYSNGTSMGHAGLRQWIHDPAMAGKAGRDPPNKEGFTRMLNSLFKAVKAMHEDMVQMRLHVIGYSQLADLSINYKNEITHYVVTDLFVGSPSMKDDKIIVFTPITFEQLESFMTQPLEDAYGSKMPIKITFMLPPVHATCDSLDEALQFKVTDELRSKLKYVGSKAPVHSVLIRPLSANLKLGPAPKAKNKILDKLKSRQSPADAAKEANAVNLGTTDRLILKRKAPQASVNELFTKAKLERFFEPPAKPTTTADNKPADEATTEKPVEA